MRKVYKHIFNVFEIPKWKVKNPTKEQKKALEKHEKDFEKELYEKRFPIPLFLL